MRVLSKGQAKRALLAMGLLTPQPILMIDEPFEGLDPASRSELRELLNRLHQEHGVTLVMATHDVNVDRKSTRLNSSHMSESRMPSSA